MKLKMPLWDGMSLVFNASHDDLVQIAKRFAEKRNLSAAASGGAATTSALAHAKRVVSRRWTCQTALKLFGLLYGEQLNLAWFLVDHEGKVAHQEVARYLGYNGQHLLGVLSPITRNARAATGDRLACLSDWRFIEVGERDYSIDSDA